MDPIFCLKAIYFPWTRLISDHHRRPDRFIKIRDPDIFKTFSDAWAGLPMKRPSGFLLSQPGSLPYEHDGLFPNAGNDGARNEAFIINIRIRLVGSNQTHDQGSPHRQQYIADGIGHRVPDDRH